MQAAAMTAPDWTDERFQRYRQSGTTARLMQRRERAALGRAVELEFDRGRGTSLTKIAARLGVAGVQVFRYREEYRDWLRDFGTEPDEEP